MHCAIHNSIFDFQDGTFLRSAFEVRIVINLFKSMASFEVYYTNVLFASLSHQRKAISIFCIAKKTFVKNWGNFP